MKFVHFSATSRIWLCVSEASPTFIRQISFIYFLATVSNLTNTEASPASVCSSKSFDSSRSLNDFLVFKSYVPHSPPPILLDNSSKKASGNLITVGSPKPSDKFKLRSVRELIHKHLNSSRPHKVQRFQQN